MQTYYHSVTLDKDKCTGCTNCIKKCPTEAIRVRQGKAKIIDERCIDCGECIRTCPYHAKTAVTDPLSSINGFRYKIALPAPTLYGQFRELSHIDDLLESLHMMGFDEVFEVARAAEIVTEHVNQKLKSCADKPLISSACPAVVRLIQVRFPELIDRLVDIHSPMEVAARIAKAEYCKRKNLNPEDVGVFFITPCAAKMTAVRSPLGTEKSAVDGAISILEVFGLLSGLIKKAKPHSPRMRAGMFGVGWANSGGESAALVTDSYLAVDGIYNVIKVLEEMDNGNLNDLDFLEGLACAGGCVGGPLTFENAYVARNKIHKLASLLPKHAQECEQLDHEADDTVIDYDKTINPLSVMKLDVSITEALRKMERMEEIVKNLPGLDCGSCGSPNCRTLAEDIVRGDAVELDCIFKLKDKVRLLAQQMIDLSDANR